MGYNTNSTSYPNTSDSNDGQQVFSSSFTANTTTSTPRILTISCSCNGLNVAAALDKNMNSDDCNTVTIDSTPLCVDGHSRCVDATHYSVCGAGALYKMKCPRGAQCQNGSNNIIACPFPERYQ